MRERPETARRSSATVSATAAHSASRLARANQTLVSNVRFAKEMNT